MDRPAFNQQRRDGAASFKGIFFMSLRKLLDRRAAIAGEMRSLNEAAGDADMAPDAAQRFDTLKGELDGLEARISRQAALEDAERRMAGQPYGGTGDRNLDRELRGFSLTRAIADQAGIAGVDAGRERELSAEIARRAGRPFQGMAVPMSVFHEPMEQRVLTTTTPAGGPGSNLVQTDIAGQQFIDRLRNALVTRRLGARVLTGLQGNLDIPGLKTSGTAGWVNENTALTPADHEFRKVSLTPKHAGALTELSRNMLQQPSVDVEALVRADFAAILAEAVDQAAISGSGTAPVPRGILNTSGIGSVAMGTNGGAISWASVINLIGEVQIDNAEGTGFLTNAKVTRSARQTVKVSGQPVYIMEGRDRLADYPLVMSNLVPSNLTKGTSNGVCSALIFGNWSDLILGYWSELDILVNPYESTAYSKGNVQVRAMLTMDVAVRYPESFAAIQDLTT
jgi:HK97 family phage major capsid protein